MSDRDYQHPALAELTDREFTLRSGWWNFFFPSYMRINWYGDMIRADGQQGMYATQEQHDSWPDLVVHEHHKIGPG